MQCFAVNLTASPASATMGTRRNTSVRRILMAEPTPAATPVEQVVIMLFDLPCLAVRDQTGAIFIVLTDLCQALGIQTDAQVRRIQRHEHLAAGLHAFRVRRGHRIETVQCLHLQLTAGWLVQIPTARVNQDVRDRLRYLQLHLLDAVWQAFAALTGLPAQSEQIEDMEELNRVDLALRTLAELAARQAALEDSQARAREAWRSVQDRLRDLAGRLGDLEHQVGGRISSAQRGHLYHLVQAWAGARARRVTGLAKDAVYQA
ncbi:MAG: hypothetical protein EOM24_17910, partial [Chloroflexia bacterium]|nr:hypothetical protein [Chloroflexia bacterium]